MKKTALILSLLLFAGWTYSGGKQVIVDTYADGILTMRNGSEWMVFVEDRYRAKTWKQGDLVKLIYSKGFYYFDYLALNLYLNDVVHVKAVADGK